MIQSYGVNQENPLLDGYGYFLGQRKKGKKILTVCNCTRQLIHTKFFFWKLSQRLTTKGKGYLKQILHTSPSC